MQKHTILIVMVAVFLLAGCTSNYEVTDMKLNSPAFENNGMIPSKYTCQGSDVSPPLEISEVPEGTKSLALIVDDPDAPMGTWVHWVVWGITSDKTEIKEGEVPGKQGKNDFGKLNYGGPCPPSGTHRYFFKLYALDYVPGISEGSSKSELLENIEGHVVGKAELVGLYSN
jgi:Raf kinase inhibitor-like YbhB/YbcL family protein